jgi:hypothetical protein
VLCLSYPVRLRRSAASSVPALAVADEPINKPIRAVCNRQSVSRSDFTGVRSDASFCHDLKGAGSNTNQVVRAGVDVLLEHRIGVLGMPKEYVALVRCSPRTGQHCVRLWQNLAHLLLHPLDDTRAVDVNYERLPDLTYA